MPTRAELINLRRLILLVLVLSGIAGATVAVLLVLLETARAAERPDPVTAGIACAAAGTNAVEAVWIGREMGLSRQEVTYQLLTAPSGDIAETDLPVAKRIVANMIQFLYELPRTERDDERAKNAAAMVCMAHWWADQILRGGENSGTQGDR